MNLTSQQTSFIEALKSGTSNISLRAVAGAGKTTTNVALANTLPPQAKTAAIAFNTRIAKALANAMPPHVNSRTFNSLGHRALQAAVRRRLIVNPDKLDELALNLPETNFADIFVCKRIKMAGVRPESLTEDDVETMIQDKEYNKPPSLERIQRLMKASIAAVDDGLIDYDDQLYMPITYGKGFFERHDFVLVDEAQDLSPIQMEMCKRMGRLSCKYAFIGDPNQAIYGFRGAGITSMDDISKMFNTSSMPLSVSFRCPQEITKLAQAIVPDMSCPETAPMGAVNYLENFKLEDFRRGDAVLCRNNAPLFSLALQCYQRNIPARLLGSDIGLGIVRQLDKTGAVKSSDAADRLISKWQWEQERAQAKRKLSRVAMFQERIDAVSAMLDFAPPLWSEWKSQLLALFNSKEGVVLSSIHKAKGLEWPRVWFLDRKLIPSKYAKEDWEKQQEDNLYYVAVTRVVGDGTLNFINSGGQA